MSFIITTYAFGTQAERLPGLCALKVKNRSAYFCECTCTVRGFQH